MRKITLLTVASLCFSVFANAQITKGSIFLGGSISYVNTTEHRLNPPTQTDIEGTLSTLAISPAIGIAVKPNLVTGIDFTYGNINYDNIQNVFNYEAKALGGGAFLRKFFPLAKGLYAFGQVRAGFESLSSEQKSSFNPNERDVMDGWNLNASIYPGITYNVTKSLYLEAGFNNLFLVTYQKEKNEQFSGVGGMVYTTERKSFGISSSLSNPSNITVGVRFILPKK